MSYSFLGLTVLICCSALLQAGRIPRHRARKNPNADMTHAATDVDAPNTENVATDKDSLLIQRKALDVSRKDVILQMERNLLVLESDLLDMHHLRRGKRALSEEMLHNWLSHVRKAEQKLNILKRYYKTSTDDSVFSRCMLRTRKLHCCLGPKVHHSCS